jgi:hypothetical protein
MIIGRIRGATRVLGKPANWHETHPDQECGELAIVDIPAEQGGPQMVSAWFPTPEEMMLLRSGQPVYLSIFGTVHPPVALWVPKE